MICPICGAELDNEASECFLCGYKFSGNPQENEALVSEENTSNISTEEFNTSGPKKSKLPIIIVIVIVILLLAGIVVYGYYFMKNANKDNSLLSPKSTNTTSRIQTKITPKATTSTPVSTKSTTTTPTTTTTTTAPTTTTVKEYIYAKELVNVTKGNLLEKYFNYIYDTDYISLGQQNVVSLENTSVFPYYKFAFWYMEADKIPDTDVNCGIYVLPGGQIDERTTIGMTYNELKEIYHFEGASLDGGTFGYTAWIKVNGVKWGIEFKLNTDDKARLGYPALGEPVDLSEINPPSDLGYYIESVQ